MLTPLNLPVAPLKLSRSKDIVYVVCLLRKKKLKLTPEEWVRQHIIHFLISYRNYPESLLKVEHGINVHQLFRRCDLVAYDRNAQPRIIIECKAPDVSISQLTFEQAAHYNQHLKTDFLFLSNGLEHIVLQIDSKNRTVIKLEDIPYFDKL